MEIPAELKDKDLIFHFTRARTAIENILFDWKLRFSPMNEMNDPYEYKMSSRGIIPRGHIDDNTLNEAMILLMNTILIADSGEIDHQFRNFLTTDSGIY